MSHQAGLVGAAVDGTTTDDPRERLRMLAPSEVKLHAPRQRPGTLDRTELRERVAGQDIALVIAPAGYGKTTLLAQVAAEHEHVAWLSLTPEDNDVAVFVAYLARALDALEPLDDQDLLALIAPDAFGLTEVLPRLGRIISGQRKPATIVLDDVHLLSRREGVRVLELLAWQLPSGWHLVLGGRECPDIERGRLRTQRAVAELDAADLALSAHEGQQLLGHVGLVLDLPAAGKLVDRAEGWPTGVYLAGRALVDHDDEAGIDEIELPLVDQYLHEQMIGRLSDSTVEFLTATSILDELDGATCDRLLGRTDSIERLAELVRANQFVVPITSTATHFRYHQLFADALRHELRKDPERERRLHTDAADLFAERGDVTRTIRHARQAGDIDRAAALVWAHAPSTLGRGLHATVMEWLSWFTKDDLDNQPNLCMAHAWCGITATETQPVAVWLDLARRHDPTEPLADGAPLGSAIALIDAVAGQQGVGPMLEAADLSIELDRGVRSLTSVAHCVAGTGLALLGRTAEARERLQMVIDLEVAVPAIIANALAQLAIIAINEGEWTEARHLADRGLALNDRYRIAERPLQTGVFASAALIAATRGDAVAARRHLNQARWLTSRLSHLSPWMPVQGRILMARAELQLGGTASARQLLVEANDLLRDLPDAGILSELMARATAEVDEANTTNPDMAVPLTTAELRVLRYLPTHLSYQGIAEDLYVSRNTVKSQAAAIYRKLGVSSRQGAVARAREWGLLDDQPA